MGFRVGPEGGGRVGSNKDARSLKFVPDERLIGESLFTVYSHPA